jgi:transcription antitermination protein NusB
MGARSKARKRALDLLYAAELRGEGAGDALDRAIAEGESPTNDYTVTLVRGVVEHSLRIDELLATYSEGWTLDRMPAVDRNLSRIAVYEIVFRDDIDDAVAVSEAVELAEELSTDNSPRFLNGLLARIAEYAAP